MLVSCQCQDRDHQPRCRSSQGLCCRCKCSLDGRAHKACWLPLQRTLWFLLGVPLHCITESQWTQASRTLVSLTDQQLVDCSKPGCHSCADRFVVSNIGRHDQQGQCLSSVSTKLVITNRDVEAHKASVVGAKVPSMDELIRPVGCRCRELEKSRLRSKTTHGLEPATVLLKVSGRRRVVLWCF